MDEIASKTLDNGVRVLTEPVGHVGSASVGLWCNTGSVHERDGEAGITHFIEHMLFKGTRTRTAKQIADLLAWPRGTVLSMLHRTRRKLKESLRDRNGSQS